ncbi:MAG: hypothetical protein Q4C59_10880 [Lachnospiraceae bacterium]|nr:hypothetical protein [Lachnospiraceae bacterium]
MNANTELLNYIYQNSQMGCDTLEQIMENSDDPAFKDCLKKQQEGYQKFHTNARDMLQAQGETEKGLSTFEKARTSLMIDFQTMTDRSTSHLAEMLIQGSSMGITNAVKKVNEYEADAEKDIVHMMHDLQHFEERNVEQLKEYL